MDHKAELEALRNIMSDACAEPIKLSYGLMISITNSFSIEIGRGGFGVVYKGVLPNGDVVAVKKLSNPHTLSDKKFLDEITSLKKAKHKNIVRFLGYCSETQEELLQYKGANIMAEMMNKLLCFEYVSNGNIQHYLQKEKPHRDDWQLRYQMIRGIVEGLHYLHDQKINHLDLKPENVMLDTCMDPKITDFGLSRCLDQGQSKLITQHIFGTPRYIAPEVIDKGEISFKADIYALGIIIIELVTGVSRMGLDNWDESLDFGCSRVRRCAEIARNCTDPDSHNRPTVLEVIMDLDELECSLGLTNATLSSVHQVAHSAFSGTDLVDLYPVELRFAFVPNQEMHCHVGLTNKTTDSVCFFFTSESSDRFRDRYKDSACLVPPQATLVFTLIREAEEGLPSDMEMVEVVAIAIPHVGIFNEKMLSTYLANGIDMPAFEFADTAHKLLGYEFHGAKLTAVIGESDNDDRVTLRQSTMLDIVGHGDKEEKESNSIEIMDVHPTEPWVLITPDEDNVYIWNWQTGHRTGAYTNENKKITPNPGSKEAKMSSIFIIQEQWVVTGDKYGYILVLTCPGMDKVKKFKGHGSGVNSLAVHPTRPLMLSCSGTLLMKLWDWKQDWSCTAAFDITEPVTQVMFDPRHVSTFATRHNDAKIQVWRIGRPDSILETTEIESKGICNFFTYSGDRHLIAFTFLEGISLINPPHCDIVHNFYIQDAAITAVFSHSTLPVLVTASEDGSIFAWDSTTYMFKKAYTNLPRNPIRIGFTASGRLLIGYMHGISVIDIHLE